MLRIDMTQKKVADFFKESISTLRSIVRRKKKQAPERKKYGKKKLLRPHCHRRLVNYFRNNIKQPLYIKAAQLRTVSGTKFSVRTNRRYIDCSGVPS